MMLHSKGKKVVYSSYTLPNIHTYLQLGGMKAWSFIGYHKSSFNHPICGVIIFYAVKQAN